MAAATQVRERPILFSDRLVRAILDGRKTQTRRVVKTRPENDTRVGPAGDQAHVASPEALAHCPFGAPGDRLWVRECFSLNHSGHVSHRGILYRATALTDRSHHGRWARCEDGRWFDFYGRPMTGQTRWRPSIHMPKWASRITLEVTGVRVERLHEITDSDIDAEGLATGDPRASFRRARFIWGWDEINANRRGCGWDMNPWVWVVEFRRVQP